MDPDDFMMFLMSFADEFIGQIATGAQWEIAAHNTLTVGLAARNQGQAREIRYPGTREAVDLAFVHNGRVYLVEIKVESAQNAGQFAGESLARAFAADKLKLGGFDLPGFVAGSGLEIGRKWVVVIAYSDSAKQRMRESGFFSRLYSHDAILAGIADA